MTRASVLVADASMLQQLPAWGSRGSDTFDAHCNHLILVKFNYSLVTSSTMVLIVILLIFRCSTALDQLVPLASDSLREHAQRSGSRYLRCRLCPEGSDASTLRRVVSLPCGHMEHCSSHASRVLCLICVQNTSARYSCSSTASNSRSTAVSVKREAVVFQGTVRARFFYVNGERDD